jgi:hypothetical protein
MPKRSTRSWNARSFGAFYDRDPQGIPRRWLDVVRQAMLSVTLASARRMVNNAEEMWAGHAPRAAAAIIHCGCGLKIAD